MKNLYPVFCLILCALQIDAQVILIDQIVFEDGDEITVVFPSQEVNEGNDGAGNIWNFGSVSGPDTIVWRGIDPTENAIGSDLWPESELGAQLPDPSNDTIDFEFYQFYKFDLDRIATIGTYFVLKNKNTGQMDTTIVDSSEDPLEEFQFPIAYESTFNSDYRATVTSKVQGIETFTRRGGVVDMVADATGTIITPIGTFENVIRVKRVETQSDTLFTEFMGQTFETYTTFENVYYDWIQPGRKFTLFRVIYTTTVIPGFPPVTGPPTSFFTYSLNSTNTKDLSGLGQSISLFPNPTSNFISVKNEKNLAIKEVKVYNSHGQLATHQFDSTNLIDMSSVTSGIYYIVIETKQGVFTQKVFKK